MEAEFKARSMGLTALHRQLKCTGWAGWYLHSRAAASPGWGGGGDPEQSEEKGGGKRRAGSQECTRATGRGRDRSGKGVLGRAGVRAARAHRAASLVVVLVHGRARVRPVLTCVRELPGHKHPEVGVLAAASPLPAFSRRPFMMRVAATDGGGALGTGACDGEGHAG